MVHADGAGGAAVWGDVNGGAGGQAFELVGVDDVLVAARAGAGVWMLAAFERAGVRGGDPGAAGTAPEFVFVDDPEDVPADATPFDMRGVELSHHRGNCSFETFLERYELDDPVLWEIAKIVHEADLGDERFDAPEAPGMDVLLRGLSLIYDDD